MSEASLGGNSETRAETEARVIPEIEVDVNGEVRRLVAGTSVLGLLETLGLGAKRVAVAVNRVVIIRSRYTEVDLTEGDRIEILEAVGGG